MYELALKPIISDGVSVATALEEAKKLSIRTDCVILLNFQDVNVQVTDSLDVGKTVVTIEKALARQAAQAAQATQGEPKPNGAKPPIPPTAPVAPPVVATEPEVVAPPIAEPPVTE